MKEFSGRSLKPKPQVRLEDTLHQLGLESCPPDGKSTGTLGLIALDLLMAFDPLAVYFLNRSLACAPTTQSSAVFLPDRPSCSIDVDSSLIELTYWWFQAVAVAPSGLLMLHQRLPASLSSVRALEHRPARVKVTS